jgi:hypothetical protein
MTDLPTQRDFEDFSAWTGRDVLAPDGSRLGTVELIFLDEATNVPEWVLVRLDDADTASFVPLAGASVEEDAIRVEQDRERIAAAPRLEVEDTLTVTECRRLYDHYGLAYSQEESPTVLPEGAGADSEERPRLRKYVGAPVAAAETSPGAEPGGTSPGDEPGGTSPGDDPAGTSPGDDPAGTSPGDDPAGTSPGDDSSTGDMPTTKGTGLGEPTPTRIAPAPPRPIPPAGGFQAQQGDIDQPGGPLALLRKRPALPITLAGGIAALIGFLVLRRRR